MARPFHWFAGASFEELRRQMITAPTGARLEVHLDGPEMYLYVLAPGMPSTEEVSGGINDSHVCPPACP